MLENPLNLCRIQWINAEIAPRNYVFKWERKESRFAEMFELLRDSQDSSTVSSTSSGVAGKENDNNENCYPFMPGQNYLTFQNDFINNSNEDEASKQLAQKQRIYDIDIVKILTLKDTRTTLMIKNIPNNFTKEQFLTIFNKKFKGKFSLFILPTDAKDKKNYGYAFITFENFFDIIMFFTTFHGKRWKNTNSLKICEIAYSKTQGMTRILKHHSAKSIYIKNESLLNNSQLTEEQKTSELFEIKYGKSEIPLAYKKLILTLYPGIPIEIKKKKKVFVVDTQNIINYSCKGV